MIWMTPFDPDTKQCIESSAPTQFTNINELVDAIGMPIKKTKCFAIYEDMIYSKLKWHVAEEVSFL